MGTLEPMAEFSYAVSNRLPPAPARRTRVVLTGATGYIASQLVPLFRERYDLVEIDVRPGDRVRQVNLVQDAVESLRPHFESAEAVVHLGDFRPQGLAASGAGKSYLDERPNVDMAERVYRLSLDCGARRVVVASSNHAADWYEQVIHTGRLDMVGPQDLPKSDNYYGWAKVAY